MTDSPDERRKTKADAARDRSAAALRENLKRRKAKVREQAVQQPASRSSADGAGAPSEDQSQ